MSRVHDDDTSLLGIGELADRTGLSVKLIRHWSDIGVVPPAGRTPAGYRLYEPQAVARLQLARTLRALGLGMAAIRDVVARDRPLAEVAAIHADALEAQIRTLRLQQAVLRSATNRRSTVEELAFMTELARQSADERNAIIREFVVDAMGDLNAPSYRDGWLSVTPDLPDHPTAEQVDAWIELGELVRDPALRDAMRRMAKYAAEHSPGPHDEPDLAAAQQVTDLWTGRVGAAIDGGIFPDSPAAEPVVAEVVAAWLPIQSRLPDRPESDGPQARRALLAQLEMAADTRVERYWQLMCVINGRPVPPSLAAAGDWLMTALRANPEPGAQSDRIARILDGGGTGPDPAGMLTACEQVLAEVGALVDAVPPDRLADPTPCAEWDVRALLDHLVSTNLRWTNLAEGVPITDFTADHLGEDHVAAFRAAAEAALAAFHRPGMLERQYGPAPGWRLVEQVVIEMLVHGWDLAKALGRPTDLVPDVAEAMLPVVDEIYGSLPRTAGASFAPARPAPDGATAADRVAAALGRPLDWTPATATRTDRH